MPPLRKKKEQPSADLRALVDAVENLHRVKASFVRSIKVQERFQGATVWRGLVSLFELTGHPTASLCYAWSSAVEGSNKRRFYAVLKIPPVDSPEAAVRAAIVADHKAGRSA